MLRTIGIWVSGILASMIIGGAIGSLIVPYPSDAPLSGFIAGAAAFTCMRLWLTEQPKRPS